MPRSNVSGHPPAACSGGLPGRLHGRLAHGRRRGVSGRRPGKAWPAPRGAVDIALIAALHRAGLASPDAVGAVLLYRIITFKILVSAVWVGYQYVHDHARRGIG